MNRLLNTRLSVNAKRNRWMALVASWIALSIAVSIIPAAFAANCEGLAGLSLPNTTITSAKAVAAGTFTAGRGQVSNLPAFCQVHGVIKPTAVSAIHFEVWMPDTNGNGKLQVAGNGSQPASQVDADHDILTAAVGWVEKGAAPEKIIATKYVDGAPAKGIALQLPLCMYPAVAKYKGSGDVKDASSFACVKP